MRSINHRYVIGQVVKLGNIKVTIEEQREFWGKPSYLVCWFDNDNELHRGVLREDEIS